MRVHSTIGRAAGAAALAVVLVAPAVVPDAHLVVAPPQAHSFALFGSTARATGSTPSGLTPSDIASAYGITGGTTATIGIVTAYDAPNLEADLAVSRSQWGLPACTTANGCFRKVGQSGGSTLPDPDTDWAIETSLDVQAASAACPSCSLLVVEANSAYISDLGPSVNTAVSLGAQVVSASWGATEGSGANAYSAAYFTHPGVPIVAAAGDSGYQTTPNIPASLPTVIAVGGTTLRSSAGVHSAAASSAPHVLASGRATVVPTAVQLRKAKATLTHLLQVAAQHRRAVARLAAELHRHPSAAARHRLATARAVASRSAARAAAARRQVQAIQRRIAAAPPATSRPSPAPPTPTASPTPTTAAPTPTTTPTQSPVAFAASRSGWTESAWSGGGSGCSAVFGKPAWQSDTMCARRTVVDIAAVGDPATGLAVYDSYNTSPHTANGWLVVGGTSLAAPLIAGMLAASGHASAYSDASGLYGRSGAFWDVATGSNGSCGSAGICTAGVGADGPTGVGTPKSLASF